MSDQPTTETLSPDWQTARCRVRDSVADEAPELARLYNSCTALVGAVDPTFGGANEGEVLGLVEKSLRAEAGFRMQTIALRDGGERIGYFHLSHGHPRPETAWVSILVLGVEFQGQGYGAEVARGLVGQLGVLPWCREVWLRVYTRNERALRHWAAVGFRHIVEVRPPDGAAPGDGPSLILSYRCP